MSDFSLLLSTVLTAVFLSLFVQVVAFNMAGIGRRLLRSFLPALRARLP